MNRDTVVSVIIPAHNEAECIGEVVDDLKAFSLHSDLDVGWEILVVDNGSTDTTSQVACDNGAVVIAEPRLGYGQACWRGIEECLGDILLFVDGDGSVDVLDIKSVLHELTQGADLVIGVRSWAEPDSMTLAQRAGNWLACFLIRALWGYPVRDLGPLRAIHKETLQQLNMFDRDYGWTIEMQLNAYSRGLRVVDVPVHWLSRISGQSKIGGTLKGVFLAGRDIIGTIFKLWWRQHRNASLSRRSKLSSQPISKEI